MNENAKVWVAALRSGDYKQTQRTLHDTEGYCCLGVACDLYLKATGNGHWEFHEGPLTDWNSPGRPYSFIFNNTDVIDGELEVFLDMETASLPDPVREWLGLSDVDGGYDDWPTRATLAGRNDEGNSFEAIADIIESEPVNLFKS